MADAAETNWVDEPPTSTRTVPWREAYRPIPTDVDAAGEPDLVAEVMVWRLEFQKAVAFGLTCLTYTATAVLTGLVMIAGAVLGWSLLHERDQILPALGTGAGASVVAVSVAAARRTFLRRRRPELLAVRTQNVPEA
jgi:hypothetical protein